MRFWARAGSLALASVAAACAFGQSFGTFGFDPYPVVPGFKISSEGFVVDESAADVFRFAVPLRSVRLTSITDRTAAWETDADLRSPQGFEANLRSPGFVMRVRERFRLRLRSLGRPVLTVDIATYDGAPTPTTTWVLCSLPDGQPPILFSFLDGISDARVTGAPGDWTLQFGAAYSGRIRVALPFGQRPYRPDLTSAARFGAAARELRSRKFWTSAPPRSIGYTAESVPGGLITRWTFDRPGAMVPTTALLASRLSGVRIESPYDLLTESFAEGPFGVATGPELAIRWPVPQRVRGKAVTWGAPFGPALAAEEQIWLAAADDSVREAALAAVHRRYAELPRFRLPVSGSTAPGSLTPEGLQTLARLAWDHQALLTVLDRPSGANLALTVLLWTMNHRTYALPLPAEDRARVAAACLLTGDPTRTLQGAQIAAGLRAEAARQDHRKAQGFSPGPDGPPADLTLEALFGRTMPTQGWTRLLGSPLWQLAGPPIWVEQDEQGWLLSFLATETRPVDLRLHSWQVYRLEPGPGIGQTVELPTSEEQVRGHRLVPTRTGLVQARIRFQAPATRFPRTVPGLR